MPLAMRTCAVVFCLPSVRISSMPSTCGICKSRIMTVGRNRVKYSLKCSAVSAERDREPHGFRDFAYKIEDVLLIIDNQQSVGLRGVP